MIDCFVVNEKPSHFLSNQMTVGNTGRQNIEKFTGTVVSHQLVTPCSFLVSNYHAIVRKEKAGFMCQEKTMIYRIYTHGQLTLLTRIVNNKATVKPIHTTGYGDEDTNEGRRTVDCDLYYLCRERNEK